MYSVLLVDDEPRAIEGLQLFVDWERLGFYVCGTCSSGAEALAAARKLAPDVVVTDIRMPEMDGLELIGQLREESHAPAAFVVLSAYGEFSYAKRAMQLGVYHFLLKPVMEEEAAEVLGEIRTRLDSRRASDEGAAEASMPAAAAHRLKELLLAIEDGDSNRAKDVIDGMCLGMEGCTSDWTELFAGSLAVQCGKLIRGLGGDPAAWPLAAPAQSGEAGGPEHARARFQSYAEQAIRAVQTLRERKPGGTLAEIDRYVRERYRSPLSIRDVAAKFFLNPVYLGKAYQDKFGCGLLDRMHDLRIAEACGKLRSSAEPISHIAEQVGYAHYHHFLQHFERRMGVKPAEYRASQGDNE